jgi:GxxExxY protein
MLFRSPIAESVIACAIEVHRHLGPGLLESTYAACLDHEMVLQKLSFRREMALPVEYKGRPLGLGYRVDFIVAEELLIEVKAVERVLPIHKAQALTYLRLTGVPQALLLNFCAPTMRDGIVSVVRTLNAGPSTGDRTRDET